MHLRESIFLIFCAYCVTFSTFSSVNSLQSHSAKEALQAVASLNAIFHPKENTTSSNVEYSSRVYNSSLEVNITANKEIYNLKIQNISTGYIMQTSSDKPNCEDISADITVKGFGMSIDGEVCRAAAPIVSWYLDVTPKIIFAGTPVLGKRFRIDNEYQQDCLTGNVSVASLELCVESYDYIYVSGEACAVDGCEKFSEKLISSELVNELADEAFERFKRKHYKGRTASQYISEYGGRVPKYISVLDTIPKIEDYKLIDKERNLYRSIMTVPVDTIYTIEFRQLNETSYRCLRSFVYVTLAFNKGGKPVHFDDSIVNRQYNEERFSKEYVSKCYNLRPKDLIYV